MCWKISTPQVANTEVTASQLVPKTEAAEPDSPAFGGSEDTYNRKKGRKQLTIERNESYNPTNM